MIARARDLTRVNVAAHRCDLPAERYSDDVVSRGGGGAAATVAVAVTMTERPATRFERRALSPGFVRLRRSTFHRVPFSSLH